MPMNNTGPTKTLGIITIATGKYFEEFIPNLRASIDRYFSFPGYQINFYCFTDATTQISGIHNIPIKHFSWPFSTLLRYRWIEKYLSILEGNDFLLYMDADMRVVSSPSVSLLDHALTAVCHPGYRDSPGAFEIDRQDSCYVPPPLRKEYFQGCFWGGKKEYFVRLIRFLSAMVDKDLKEGNIPIWHDESYLNKYLSEHHCKALPPVYAWPEGEQANQEPIILHLEKKHQTIRQAPTDLLDIDGFLTEGNKEAALEIYKKLYLNSHEKCQRLENRLVQKNIIWSKIREWLSYYRK